MYDYLVVGAGLFGATFAYEATKKGKSCCVIDRRKHIGGNCYTKRIHGIDVHMYGAHIFKTNDKDTWDFINSFAEFYPFINTPIAICDIQEGTPYNLPFNMNTFAQVFGVSKPNEVKEIIEKETRYLPEKARNLEEYAIKCVGETLYHMFISGYTEKQWGKPCSQLPMSILSDIPIRLTYNNNYYDKRYQGVPIGGYTQIISKMLNGSDVVTNMSFDDACKYQKYREAKKVIYTGAIDEFFSYRYGRLKYRSLKFVHTCRDVQNANGVAVMNFTEYRVPYTRVIEHKHFCSQESDKTILTYEYPKDYTGKDDAYYPMEDDENVALYKKYLRFSKKVLGDTVVFGGRLGSYHYDDMAECIEKARELARKELNV